MQFPAPRGRKFHFQLFEKIAEPTKNSLNVKQFSNMPTHYTTIGKVVGTSPLYLRLAALAIIALSTAG